MINYDRFSCVAEKVHISLIFGEMAKENGFYDDFHKGALCSQGYD